MEQTGIGYIVDPINPIDVMTGPNYWLENERYSKKPGTVSWIDNQTYNNIISITSEEMATNPYLKFNQNSFRANPNQLPWINKNPRGDYNRVDVINLIKSP